MISTLLVNAQDVILLDIMTIELLKAHISNTKTEITKPHLPLNPACSNYCQSTISTACKTEKYTWPPLIENSLNSKPALIPVSLAIAILLDAKNLLEEEGFEQENLKLKNDKTPKFIEKLKTLSKSLYQEIITGCYQRNSDLVHYRSNLQKRINFVLATLESCTVDLEALTNAASESNFEDFKFFLQSQSPSLFAALTNNKEPFFLGKNLKFLSLDQFYTKMYEDSDTTKYALKDHLAQVMQTWDLL